MKKLQQKICSILVKTICQNTTRVLYIKWKKLSTTLPIQLKELFTTFLIMQHLLMNKLTTYRMITLSSHNILDKLLLPSRFYQGKPLPSLLTPVTVQYP